MGKIEFPGVWLTPLAAMGLLAAACASGSRPVGNDLVLSKSRLAKGPLKSGPVAYFQQNCAHCHGPFGDTYTDHFYTITDFEKLKADVKRMADGPGQASIDGDDLTAQVDFHKAMIAKGPFIDWTGQDGSSLSGEVTRGSTLEAESGGKALPVTLKKWKWTLDLPAGISADAVTLKATLDKKQSTLKLGDAAWSNAVEDVKS